MNKKFRVLLYFAAVILWTAAIWLIRGTFDARRIRLLEEEKKFLIMWIENRHGPGWSERVEDWSKHKAEDRVKRFKRS